MAIFAEITENDRIIHRHLRDIHPLLNYDASESQSMILDLIEGFSVNPDFNIMQQSHGLSAITKLLVLSLIHI